MTHEGRLCVRATGGREEVFFDGSRVAVIEDGKVVWKAEGWGVSTTEEQAMPSDDATWSEERAEAFEEEIERRGVALAEWMGGELRALHAAWRAERARAEKAEAEVARLNSMPWIKDAIQWQAAHFDMRERAEKAEARADELHARLAGLEK